MMRQESSSADTSAGNTTGKQSTSALLSNLATDVSELMRGEVYLARAELREAVKDAKKGAIGIGMGTALLTGGVLTLIAFLVLAVAEFLSVDLWLSALVVGLIATLLGLVLLKSGVNKLSADNLTPTRFQSSLKKTQRQVKEKLP